MSSVEDLKKKLSQLEAENNRLKKPSNPSLIPIFLTILIAIGIGFFFLSNTSKNSTINPTKDYIKEVHKKFSLEPISSLQNELVSIVIFGASGDLAVKKLFPSLFQLYTNGVLPPNTQILGFSRSNFTNEDFRTKISKKLIQQFEKQIFFLPNFLLKKKQT